MIFVTTSPCGPSTHSDDWQATLDIVEAATATELARRAFKEAELRRYEAREALIAAERAEEDARIRAARGERPRCPGE
jgi:hypothetical protein